MPGKRKKIRFSMQNPFKINCFLPVAGSEPKFKLKWIIFRPWPDRRRLGEEEKGFSPYRRGMRFLMLMRYRGGQPPSHHTVVTSDVRNSFYRKCRKYMRFGISLRIFRGDFWPPFWGLRRCPKKRPYRWGREKKTAFFMNKNCFFCFQFWGNSRM